MEIIFFINGEVEGISLFFRLRGGSLLIESLVVFYV